MHRYLSEPTNNDRPLQPIFDKLEREESLRHQLIDRLPLPAREKRFIKALDFIAHERCHSGDVTTTSEGRTRLTASKAQLRRAMQASIDTVRRAREVAGNSGYVTVELSNNDAHLFQINWPEIVRWNHEGIAPERRVGVAGRRNDALSRSAAESKHAGQAFECDSRRSAQTDSQSAGGVAGGVAPGVARGVARGVATATPPRSKEDPLPPKIPEEFEGEGGILLPPHELNHEYENHDLKNEVYRFFVLAGTRGFWPRDISAEHLRDAFAVDELHRIARRLAKRHPGRYIGPSESDRGNFFAMAAYAVRTADNPPAAFTSNLMRRRWYLISQPDDEWGRKAIAEVDRVARQQTGVRPAVPANELHELLDTVEASKLVPANGSLRSRDDQLADLRRLVESRQSAAQRSFTP